MELLCPICGFIFESIPEYIYHRHNCVDVGVNQLIKEKCKGKFGVKK